MRPEGVGAVVGRIEVGGCIGEGEAVDTGCGAVCVVLDYGGESAV